MLGIGKPIASSGLGLEELIAAFEECARNLEYDKSLPHVEAERLPRF